MTPAVLPVLLAYAALLFVTLLAVLWSRWPAWLKGLLVVAVTVFHFYAQHVAGDLSGWPSTEPLPERFVLIGAVVDEPNAKHAGGLYLWIHAIVAGQATTLPRAYRVPYTRELHLQLNEGTRKLRAGISQMGVVEPPKGDADHSVWMRAGSSDAQVIRLQDLPGPQLPEK